MRARRLISFVAVLGMLLHAAALIRHHDVMLGATLQHQALLTDLAQICHGGTGVADVPSGDLPTVPAPTDAQNGEQGQRAVLPRRLSRRL